MKRRGGRAVLALLVGLLVGGWVGGGLVWVLNRHKYTDPETVLNVNLGKMDEVEMIPADAMGFVHIRLRDVWNTEAVAEFRNVLAQAGPEAVQTLDEGFVPAPSSIDRATVVFLKAPPVPPPPEPALPPKGFVRPPAPPPPPPLVFGILAFSKPFDADQVRKASFPNAAAMTAGGKEYWKDGRTGLAVYFPNDHVAVLGMPAAIESYLSNPPNKEGPLSGAIGIASRGERHLVAGINTSAALPSFSGNVESVIPPEARPILRADALTIGLVLDRGAKIDLRAAYKDEETAANAEKAIRTAAEEGRKKLAEMKKQAEEAVRGRPGAKKPQAIGELPEAVGGLFTLGALNILDAWLADPHLERNGKEVSASATMSTLASPLVAATAMSVGTLMPAVQKVRTAAARTSDSNNLKQMGIAMHAYQDVNGKLPTSAWGTKFDKGSQTGNLSWRVAILPFLQQGPLYNQFKLDEPWDSEHNKKLIPLMPQVYMNPQAPTEPGQTYYKVFVGNGTAIGRDGSHATRIPASFLDGTSNTILIAEGGEPVIWTKPDDFEFDPAKPLPNLGVPGAAGVNVCLADSSVRFIDLRRVSQQTLKAAITASGGDIMGKDW